MLKMPRQTGAFPPANNLLQKKWNEKAYKQHLEKRKSMTTGLNTKKPKSYLHLQLNLKKIQLEEERQEAIDHENRILLAKLTHVIQSAGQLDNWNEEYDELPKSLNGPQMIREQERISAENSKLTKKLDRVTAQYDFDQWEDEYLLHEYYLSLKAQETKGFEVDVRGFDEDELHFYNKDKEVTTGIGSAVQSNDAKTDVNEQSDSPTGSASTGAISKTHKKPSGATRRPKPQPKLPLLGQNRKKEEEKRRREAASRPTPYDDKEDAARLFKATKGMAKAEPTFIHALVRRTYSQRQKTKATFEKLFELDLEIELIELLGEEWSDLISVLLAKREVLDAVTLRQALHGELPLTNTVIGVLCTRNNSAISAIKKAYVNEYSTQLIDDIKNETKGQLRHLFLALAKGTRMEDSETDIDRARLDVGVLLSEPEGERWKAEAGKMAQLLRMASFSQIREVLEQYEQLEDRSVLTGFQKTLGGDYKDAMYAMVKCLYNCAMYMAERHQTSLLKRDSSSLIRLLVTRSEIDMPQIRKVYRQRYGATLMDAINNLCREPYKKALVAMVQLHGSLANQQQEQTAKADNPRSYSSPKPLALPKVVSPSNKTKPMRRPSPNKTATVNAANPLVKSLQASSQGGGGGGGPRDSILVSRRPTGAPKKTVTVVDPKTTSSPTRSATKQRQQSPTKAGVKQAPIRSTRNVSREGSAEVVPATPLKSSQKGPPVPKVSSKLQVNLSAGSQPRLPPPISLPKPIAQSAESGLASEANKVLPQNIVNGTSIGNPEENSDNLRDSQGASDDKTITVLPQDIANREQTVQTTQDEVTGKADGNGTTPRTSEGNDAVSDLAASGDGSLAERVAGLHVDSSRDINQEKKDTEPDDNQH